MADKSFRAYRNRDPLGDADPSSWAASDPLAELARLIGQIDPVGERSRDSATAPRDGFSEAPPLSAHADWPTDERYDEPEQYAQSVDVQPRFVEAYRDRSYPEHDRDDEQYARDVQYPAQANFDDEHIDAPQDDRYRDEHRLPALAPQAADMSYDAARHWRDGAPDDQSYEVAEYDEPAAGGGPRRRIAMAVAIVGLVALGGAGAYGYHTMFGGGMLPSLPPIIKASNEPNRIIPSHSNAQADMSSQGDSSNSAGAKLVPREEQPLNIQTPSDSPRVISTIPILPDPGAASQAAPGVPSVAASAPQLSAGAASTPSAAPPAPLLGPTPDAAASSEPRKIHTVIIHEDQPGGPATASAGATPLVAAPPTAPAADAPARRVARRINSQPPANAPLELVPGQSQAFPPPPAPRTRLARSEPGNGPLALQPSATASSSGGYAVQVSSQRSEQEARATFRSLQAKYPDQLGRREPIIRRADLGAKGTYYRTLVGPFASAEEAAAMCGKLKAAGGNCLVERN